jgi:TolB protein
MVLWRGRAGRPAQLTDNNTGSGVRGEIVGQGGSKFPIAVAPLKNLGTGSDPGKLSEGIADAIVYDLELSGWFKVIDRSAYRSAANRGISALSLAIGRRSAPKLVKGGFAVQGDEVTVELRLFDVFQNKERIGGRCGSLKQYRRIAHKFGIDYQSIYRYPGIFNTKIAYVSTSEAVSRDSYLTSLAKFQVTNNRTINLSPSWSRTVNPCFTSLKPQSSLYRFELFSGRVKWAAPNGRYLGGKLSPDGQYVAASIEVMSNTSLAS